MNGHRLFTGLKESPRKNNCVNEATLISLLPFGCFCAFLMLQILFPRRPMPNVWWQTRFIHNLSLFLLNAVIARFVVPLSLLAVAASSYEAGFGLFNLIPSPTWLEVLLTVIVLDFSIYVQHVATHKIPLLWRLHKVHHADREMDVSTAVRFHPVELVLSTGYKAVLIALLGASEMAVAVFVLLLFVGPAFNHSNLQLAQWLDKLLRFVIATPDVHRTHHSVYRREQDTNYGFFLIWWDKWFDTYTEEPMDGHAKMNIGLPRDQESEQTRIDQMLLAPFIHSKAEARQSKAGAQKKP